MNIFATIAAFIGGISPKVKAGLNWGTIAGLATWCLTLVTPQMLSWAGPFEPVLFSAIPVLVGQVAAWTKTDPLRALGLKVAVGRVSSAPVETVAAPVPDPTPAAPVAPTTTETGNGSVAPVVTAPASVFVPPAPSTSPASAPAPEAQQPA